MAVIIPFRTPDGVQNTVKWIPPHLLGKVIKFPKPEKRSA